MSKVNELFKSELKVVNFGIEAFYQDLQKQEKPAIHIEWKPVASGNKKLAGMLNLLK